jgi:hypothetical protein
LACLPTLPFPDSSFDVANERLAFGPLAGRAHPGVALPGQWRYQYLD